MGVPPAAKERAERPTKPQMVAAVHRVLALATIAAGANATKAPNAAAAVHGARTKLKFAARIASSCTANVAVAARDTTGPNMRRETARMEAAASSPSSGPAAIAPPAASTYPRAASAKKAQAPVRPSAAGRRPTSRAIAGTARNPPPTADPPTMAAASTTVMACASPSADSAAPAFARARRRGAFAIRGPPRSSAAATEQYTTNWPVIII